MRDPRAIPPEEFVEDVEGDKVYDCYDCLDCGTCASCIERTTAYAEEMENEVTPL